MTGSIRLLLWLASCLVAGTGWADTRVRSGEHASFTRLVLYLPGPVEAWTPSDAEGGYVVDITPAPAALDTSDVFAFIPRTRISDVALRDGRVRIASTCDCHISVFRARDNVIAIDVRDGPDPSRTDMPPRPLGSETATMFPVLFASPDGDARATWRVDPRIAFVPPQERPVQLLRSTELATAVARAASSGVLRADTAGLGIDGPGIETRSALDSAKSDRTARLQTELCSGFALLEDLDEISAAESLQLIDTAGAEASPVGRAMAYLSLGFGAEAAVDFTASELPPERAIMLAQVAHFIDAPDRPAPRSVRSASSCGGVAALLAVLGTPPSESIAEPLGLDAVNTLSRLPFPLRAHLAGYLEGRLLTAGLAELAQSANFARQRAVGEERSIDLPTPAGASGGYAPGQADLPPTAFFKASTSQPVYDTIAAARFAAEDRILIEAWIKEAPSTAEADAASTFYVAALNTAARPLDALGHLDTRFGWRGVVSPGLEAAISDTMDTATRVLGPAELLVLGARLPQRPWFSRLPQSTRNQFHEAVESIRNEIRDAPNQPLDASPQPQPTSPAGRAPVQASDPGLPTDAPGLAAASPRRIAADAAIASATDSLARSVRLRAETAERTGAWERITR